MIRKILCSLGAMAALGLAAPAAAQGCPAKTLDDISTSWTNALATGTPYRMNLGEWVDYKENFKVASLGEFFSKERKVDWQLALKDTQACRVLVETVILDPERPLVFATQMDNGFFGTGPFHNLVTDAGDWQFDAAKTLEHVSKEDWGMIPEGQRNTRAELQAIANAYLDHLKDRSVAVSWAPQCARLDGSVYVEGADCTAGLPENVAAIDRNFIIDETLGAVGVFARLGEDKVPSSQLLRIEDGKIRYVHTLASCATAGCTIK
ncbi:hypothetical protein GRI97_13675 [Altererythrobacter xixiisoli]|uniref:DUF8021 domain-containing protein n=1 Tax=Croceibacterium xixiisoli TaxID=1476466 RepID=A0A6I4TZI4_9SPHN|nr:hypothetical protein [Croceibacterium xixiisoli]MXP00039.1 hypothetical protein [Croceibacterium xixiisoli]